jgi:hypothetical protein
VGEIVGGVVSLRRAKAESGHEVDTKHLGEMVSFCRAVGSSLRKGLATFWARVFAPPCPVDFPVSGPLFDTEAERWKRRRKTGTPTHLSKGPHSNQKKGIPEKDRRNAPDHRCVRSVWMSIAEAR